MSTALDKTLVVDLTREFFSATAAALLGDFGAEVVRIDQGRRLGGTPLSDGDEAGLASLESFANRNKQKIALDLDAEKGRAALLELLSAADVLITDLSDRELAGLGIDEEGLRYKNPGLVYAVGSGFGPAGPDIGGSLLDEIAAARTGMMPILGQPGQPPVYPGHGQMYTSVMLAFAVTVALLHRDNGGGAQRVDCSLLAGNMYGASLDLQAFLAMGGERFLHAVDRLDAGNPMSGTVYRSKDGPWVTLTMPDTERYWPRFSEIVGLAVDDPRFDSHEKRCGQSRLEMMQVLEEIFSKQKAGHWRDLFNKQQMSADIIEDYRYPEADKAARANRYILDPGSEDGVETRTIGFPIHMSETPARLSRPTGPVDGDPAELVAKLVAERRAATSAVAPSDGDGGATASRLPLEGLRIVDLTMWFQGPVAAQHLADLGAEVIHFENPKGGDLARGVASIKALPVGDWNQYFLVINRNKKSMAVDLKTEGGREILGRLIKSADVFLSNLSPRALGKWGCSYEELTAINPSLIYAMGTGYGPKGTIDKPSFDMTVQALAGLMSRLGEPGQPPIYLGMGSGDAMGGLMAALAISLALYARRRSGKGQYLDASLYGAQLFMAAPSLQPYLATGDPRYREQQSRSEPVNPLWNTYEADDGWMVVCIENQDQRWRKLCSLLGRVDLAGDQRFNTVERRRGNRELVALLDEAFAGAGVRDWTERLGQAGLLAAPVCNLAQLGDDPQAWANDYLLKANCSAVGREVNIRGLPVGFSQTPGRVESLGPELGQDTELILFESLGYDWDEIGRFKEEGVIL